MKRTVINILVLVLFLTSCSTGPTAIGASDSFPTPTKNPIFQDLGSVSSQGETPSTNTTSAVPTLAKIFEPDNSGNGFSRSTVGPTITPAPTQTPVNDSPQSVDTGPVELGTTIYDDALKPNWQTVANNVDINLDNSEETFQGKKSVKITPKSSYSSAYFVLGPENTVSYTRDRVLGVSFKLTGGNAAINPSDLTVAVLGSNQYNYYVKDDKSVTNQYDPIFPETRLYYLNINQTIEPHTWVDITVWLDNLVYEPIYTNFTGFYIKNDESYLKSYYIDDVQLILLSDQNAVASTTPTISDNPSAQSQPTINIDLNLSQNAHTINPMVYGVSNAPTEVLNALQPGLNSWGGNPSSRYNWELGNAWNAGHDYFYQNTDYGNPSGSASDRFIEVSQEAGASVRMSLPTLGWVAKNSDPKTCSFPLPDGSCGNANNATCLNPGAIADPTLANVASDVDSVVKWVTHMITDENFAIQVFAMDNEPELWGVTHYDVHPNCTTYQEILQKYLQYAEAIRKVAPEVDLAGPVTCCWQYYFNSAAGPLDKLQNGNQDFLAWFLSQVRKNDIDRKTKLINVLDIHYYPEGLYNQNVDTETAAHRLRATRSLWDSTYVDESWINTPVNLIPRMKAIIADNYPGLQLGISEWNFGGDQNINGALAIADVLGIFGREDLYYANYYTYPELNSPGAFAFQMFTNYDGNGGRFGDLSVKAISDTPDLIGSYASMDRKTNKLHLILINKDPNVPLGVKVKLTNFPDPSKVELYRYSQNDLKKIIKTDEQWPQGNEILIIPPYSISHYVLTP